MEELYAARALDHPNILRCHVPGRWDSEGQSFLYLVMEIAQESLKQRLDHGVLTISEARELVDNISSGLVYLHNLANARVHRDLKPGNILRVDNSWKIGDFGLTRELRGQSTRQTSQVLGTPDYVPPEYMSGEISTAWDLWSLGVIIVEALSGTFPFGVTSHGIPSGAMLDHDPNVPDSIVEPFRQIALGCLVRDRASRWTAQQVLRVVRGGNAPSPRSPASASEARTVQRPLVWSIVAAVIVTSGLFVYYRAQAKIPVVPDGTTLPHQTDPRLKAPSQPTVPTSPAVENRGDPKEDFTPKEPKEIPVKPKEPTAVSWNPSVAFAASVSDLVKGSSTTVVWDVEGASDVKLDGEPVSPQGSRTLSPMETTTYHLKIEGPENASRDRQVTVHVTRAVAATTGRVVAPPTITAFEAVPNPVNQCSIAILRWTVKDATAVTIEPGVGAVGLSGYRVLKPLQNGQFILRAEGPSGSANREITVSVTNASRSACAQ
jgi:serine/threonine protein kinase